MAQTSSPEPPLGALLHSLNDLDLYDDAKRYVSESVITDCRAVASYNWLDREDPTIVIPARQFEPDNGQYFRDPNAAHYSKHPFEPAITAVLAMDSNISRDVDIVACGSTLGNLLRFIRGEDKQFRVLVEVVEGTVFFIRRENTARELIPDVKGYGHSFPEAYTTWDADVKGSVSHQRVLSYQFGGLGILLRFEGDGYLLDGGEKKHGNDKPSSFSDLDATQTVDGLVDELDRNRLTGAQPANGGSLEVAYGGDLVSQDRVFELKTRSVRRKESETYEDTFGDQLPRLWVAQIPNFILAYHKHGLFEEDEIGVRDVRSDIKSWERDHVDVLSRLAALIHHIADLVRSRPDGKLELRHKTIGTLEVREQLADAGDALSASVRTLWAKARAVNNGVTSGESASDSDEDAGSLNWDEGSEADFTACSEDCDYCGHCSY
ncbi:hypothetical protein VM1G_04997 [Cytospora mali]|uniref:Geranylgeranyl pyrophosphate synthetase n=1 Tax=Cytospora mali TaxID=578113 RepID=A0A194VZ69_CYTMA|nr:hypothetical protein VM1G_04997 [Valsa mali]